MVTRRTGATRSQEMKTKRKVNRRKIYICSICRVNYHCDGIHSDISDRKVCVCICSELAAAPPPPLISYRNTLVRGPLTDREREAYNWIAWDQCQAARRASNYAAELYWLNQMDKLSLDIPRTCGDNLQQSF